MRLCDFPPVFGLHVCNFREGLVWEVWLYLFYVTSYYMIRTQTDRLGVGAEGGPRRDTDIDELR